jgi:hypothetical protein
MLSIYAQENENKWEAGSSPLPRILTLLEENPFAPLQEMQLKDDAPWQKYDHQKVIREMNHDRQSSMGFRTTSPYPLEGSISLHSSRNLIQLRVDDQYLKAPDAIAKALEYTNRLGSALPNFFCGGASADLNVHDFYVERDLPFLPECFNYVDWYHIIHPRGYEPYFEADDMRKIPAYRVEELSDRSFAIMSYPDPLEFAGEEAKKRVVDITNYLNERRKDWK